MRQVRGRTKSSLAIIVGLLAAWSIVSFPVTAQAPVATECRDWVHSRDRDTRFKVWACRDGDTASAEDDIGTLSALIEEMWGPMTQPVPSGMGPPLPDASGTNVQAAYGSDPRIDFYLLKPGQAVHRGGNLRSITSTAAAAAGVSLGGSPQGGNGASGYVLVARDRLPDDAVTGQDLIRDDVVMRQDLIHEFFHVLEYAHNAYAPFPGGPPHWFTEASAVWAETYYLRDHSEEPHGWFTDFQKFDSGLADPDKRHQYAAYIWPFFMEQEVGKESIMQAWAALDGLPSGSGLDAVTDAIDHQLPFKEHFRDFAVRNLDNEALEETDPRETQYVDLDTNFPEGVPPGHMQSGSVAPGSPYVAGQSIPPLAGRYLDISLSEEAREVTVSITGLSPESAVDGDAIVHVADGWWERRPLVGGILKFCRDNEDAYDDIDRLYLVVSNHDRATTVSGDVEASAKANCAGDGIVLSGTFRGTYRQPRYELDGDRSSEEAQATIDVTITISDDPTYDWNAEGTAHVSGEITGDCRFTDSASGMFETGLRNFEPLDPDALVAGVQLYPDPRHEERPLEALVVFVYAGNPAVRGGTCGHEIPPMEDAFVPYFIDLPSCGFEMLPDGDTGWHGECHEQDPQVPGREWTWIGNLTTVSEEEQ